MNFQDLETIVSLFTWKAGNFTVFIFLVKENLVYLNNF